MRRSVYGLVIIASLSLIVLVLAYLATGSGDSTLSGDLGVAGADRGAADVDPTPARSLYIALSFLSVTTLVAVTITFYLYYWRRILLAQPHLLVPEQLGEYLGALSESIRAASQTLDQRLDHVERGATKQAEKLSAFGQTLDTLRRAVEARDQEIARLRRGYDSDVFRKFLLRFIRVDRFIDVHVDAHTTRPEDLERIKSLLRDALEECGVERFEPESGEDVRRAFGIEDNPTTAETLDPSQDLKIVEVLEPGYMLRSGSETQVVIPAKVKVAIFQGSH